MRSSDRRHLRHRLGVAFWNSQTRENISTLALVYKYDSILYVSEKVNEPRFKPKDFEHAVLKMKTTHVN